MISNALIRNFLKKARVFVSGMPFHFQLCLMFAMVLVSLARLHDA
jgi:hypothetical protein